MAAFVKKKKRENLKQKYKDLKCPATGVSTEDGEPTAASWKWYRAMDEAIGCRPSIVPPALIASSGPDVAVASTSSVSPAPDTPRASRKRTQKSIENLIKEMEEREMAREQEAVEREEKRWREMEEKEERRERDRQEREERRHAEDREREERWHQEASQREERLLRLLECIANK
ncbi:TBC1 domain family member 10B-like [Sinocyclocheilus anshuiensis]|uniref:TBC1 domain family member 10B-like n=1 Tax=Sinocyclocheilus anshuiensis TaxID=1608454 RepID=UPI0007B7E1C1|nr:PREDICTED: TBC1 domain family member 10B-like [Sinocyclocheilus anshuiensis]